MFFFRADFLGSKTILLYGGLLNDETPKNDMWIFDLETRRWSLIKPGVMCPQPADEPALFIEGNTSSPFTYKIILFCGRERSELWTADLDLESFQISWRKLDIKCPTYGDITLPTALIMLH
jgi:hypothetical protein